MKTASSPDIIFAAFTSGRPLLDRGRDVDIRAQDAGIRVPQRSVDGHRHILRFIIGQQFNEALDGILRLGLVGAFRGRSGTTPASFSGALGVAFAFRGPCSLEGYRHVKSSKTRWLNR